MGSPLPPVPGVVKTVLQHSLGEDTNLLTRFFWEYANGPASVADLSSLATEVATAWAAHLLGSFVDALVLKAVQALDLSIADGNHATVEVSDAGSNGTSAPCAGNCLVVSLLTPRRYRGGHSRVYLSGLPSSFQQDEQTWQSTVTSTLQTELEAFFTAVSGFTSSTLNSPTLATVSYFHGHTNVLYPSGYYRAVPTARSNPIVTVVEGVRVNRSIGSQRRRNTYNSG